MTAPITVTIPVGPHPSNVRWLGECLASIAAQTEPPDEVLLIDDGAHLNPDDYRPARVWATPWPSGVATAFNYGVALARNDLVIMLGSDDRLLPSCVSTCWQYYRAFPDAHGYYAMPVVYDDGREQSDPCNAAMVHKALWKLSGGFPVESNIGACDSWLISKLWIGGGRFGNIYTVLDRPLYWYRDHKDTDTHQRAAWYDVLIKARDLWLRKIRDAGARERYEYWLTNWNDVQAHLPFLYECAQGNVLELGVRAGVSTAALLTGVAEHGGHLWSLDRDDCSSVFAGHPYWTFVQADSLCADVPVPKTLDCLFIDTEHTQERTIAELRLWGPRVRPGGVILLHDTDDPSTAPGVRDAMAAYCQERGLTPDFREGSYGLGVIVC